MWINNDSGHLRVQWFTLVYCVKIDSVCAGLPAAIGGEVRRRRDTFLLASSSVMAQISYSPRCSSKTVAFSPNSQSPPPTTAVSGSANNMPSRNLVFG